MKILLILKSKIKYLVKSKTVFFFKSGLEISVKSKVFYFEILYKCVLNFLFLENGLKVILVSDPTTDKAAAAMDVNVGHMSDPWELPGLAHFLEHMLFLGTDKYPDENSYR